MHLAADQQLNQIYVECLERGMKMPFITVAISPSGSVHVSRITDVAAELLVEHIEGPGFLLPGTLLILDADNHAVTVTVIAQRPKPLN